MQKRHSLTLIAALSLGAAAFSTSFSAQAAGGTLVYCSEASPEGFDVIQYTTGTTNDVAAAIFNRLFEFERGTTQVTPALAESHTVSADGLIYTFQLRKGVKFHTTDYFKPSRNFNADDVLFSFQRLIDKKYPFNVAYPATFPYAQDTGIQDNVVSISKTDDFTVVFTLKNPDPDLLAKIAMPSFAILSQEYANQMLMAKTPAQINQQPIGTGAFVLKRYQKDSQIRFATHKEYWNAKEVKIDQLIFAITTDSAVRVQKLKAGECHLMSFPKPQDLTELKNDPNIKFATEPGFNIGYLHYNTQKPMTSKLEVRQALDMAINRKAILEAVYQGQGIEATNPIPSSLWSYNKKLKNEPQNIEKAKALLAKAGYPNGFELNLFSMPVQRPYNPNARLMAEMLQSDWAKIGVKAKIVSYEWGEYIKRTKNGEHDVGLMGWTGDYASPDNFLGILLTCSAVDGNNYSRYCNKEFDELVLKARNSINQKERIELYMKAQEVFKRDLPWTTIAHSIATVPMRKNVEGFKISPLGRFEFVGVSIK